MTYYQQSIIKATKCTEADVNEVEQLMRNEYSTLDHLSSTQFNRCARSCYKAVKFMKTPEGIAYVKQLKAQYAL